VGIGGNEVAAVFGGEDHVYQVGDISVGHWVLSCHVEFVPEEQLPIARRFNAGLIAPAWPVPEGRLPFIRNVHASRIRCM
jgi:hypothetical protein